MDLWVYANILKSTDKDVSQKRENYKYTVIEEAFRSDLAKGKTIWIDEFWSDYRRYIQNNHLLISIFSANDLHPFTIKERMVALMCETLLSFAIFVACDFFSEILSKHLMIVGGTELGAEIILFLIEAGLMSIFSLILQKLSTCASAVNKPDKARKAIEFRGHVIIGIISVFCIVSAAVSLWVFSRMDQHKDTARAELYLWISAQAFSWILDLLINLVLYVIDKHGERKSITNNECDLNVTYVDYLNWKQSLMRNKDDCNMQVTISKMFNTIN